MRTKQMDRARKYTGSSDLLGGIVSHVRKVPSSWAYWKGCKARNVQATTSESLQKVISCYSFWIDHSRMGHGPKRLLRVSSVKPARSPIRTSESRFLSKCWAKPIIIWLCSRRHQSSMARQMGVDIIAIESNRNAALDSLVEAITLYLIWIPFTCTFVALPWLSSPLFRTYCTLPRADFIVVFNSIICTYYLHINESLQCFMRKTWIYLFFMTISSTPKFFWRYTFK
jgi:hypothetical protein